MSVRILFFAWIPLLIFLCFWIAKIYKKKESLETFPFSSFFGFVGTSLGLVAGNFFFVLSILDENSVYFLMQENRLPFLQSPILWQGYIRWNFFILGILSLFPVIWYSCYQKRFFISYIKKEHNL